MLLKRKVNKKQRLGEVGTRKINVEETCPKCQRRIHRQWTDLRDRNVGVGTTLTQTSGHGALTNAIIK